MGGVGGGGGGVGVFFFNDTATTEIYTLSLHDALPILMGASFRNTDELKELAGCDLLTISPKLLAQLDAVTAELPRKLSPEMATDLEIEKISVDKATFDKMHSETGWPQISWLKVFKDLLKR